MREILRMMLAICLLVIGRYECCSQNEVSSDVDSLLTERDLLDVTAQSDMLESGISDMEFAQYQGDYSFSNSPTSSQNGRISDALLLKEYELQRAKKMKKTGIIGGSSLVVAGIATFIICVTVTEDEATFYVGTVIGGSLFIGGGLWMGCACYKANKLIQSMNYVSLVEHDLFSTGKSSMSASLDLINSKGLVKENAFGFSLKYSF